MCHRLFGFPNLYDLSCEKFTKQISFIYVGKQTMNTIEQTFHDEIEVERLWAATKQGNFVFFSILPFSLILVIVLWKESSHSLLLIWFVILTTINFLRWMSIQFYHTHKESLAANVPRFKSILVVGCTFSGLWWGMGVLWFLQPSQPLNVQIMSINIIYLSVGAILSWFSYLPAVLAVILPAVGFLAGLLFIHGNSINIALGLLFTIGVLMAVVGSSKLARILNNALVLNYENVALRQESEEKSLLLETALENMGQGISMSDKDDRLRMWNRQFADLLGSASDKVATDTNLESILNAADPPINTHVGSRTEYQLQDGRVFEIRQTEVQQGGRILTYNDITDLINRERALEEARNTAEQANSAKTRFLAAASHDLRQPIHALGLFFAELSDRVHTPETDSLITQVNDSITAINSMLNALLDVSKLDAGVVQANIESFALTEIFIRLELEFLPIALENHNQLHIRLSNVTVRSDPAMLERMLRNLINNALRYTENGRILVAARSRGKNIEIQIIDNDPGIPEDKLDEVFIEFYQVGNQARDRRQGLGLGLAIVKRLAKLLKHELTLVSRLGHGCCFSITLPLVQVKKVEPKQKERDRFETYSLDGCPVLVLDDDNDVLEGMRGLLTHWGCQVITASSPTEAFNQLALDQNKPELLIVDYRLPDNVSGIEVAKKLQSSLTYPVSVLIITGDTGPERLREASASGYPLLHKPVQPAKLRSTLQYLFSQQKKING